MAEGFEPFHVPQQSRREKLRVVQNQNHTSCEEATLHGCAGLLPLYDPSSLLPSNILNCGNTDVSKQNQVCVPSVVKEEGMNLMGYVSGFMNTASSSSSSHHNPYLDPQSTLAGNLNPTSIHDINSNPFLYTAQNLRDFDHHQSFNGHSLTNESQTTGQGLSLSLSSHHHPYQHNLPLELNQPRYDPTMFGEKGVGGYVVRGIATTSNDVRSSVPLGPFTGYASILKGSRFLKPAQQLLEELCDVGRGIYVDKSSGNSSLMDPGMDNLSGIVDDSVNCSDHSEHRRKKTRLISMLEEVYKRYKLYYQQMQAIVASFESVAGLGNAAPYTSFALNAMSKHFRSLKNAITDQLRFTSKALGEGSFSKDDAPRFGATDRWVHGQRPIQSSHEQPPVWRPQRGLPERAVGVLRAWLFEHFLHPYPTDTDKQMLAKQTGLSRSQVSNWFINARVRLWKPMVEEIHVLETRQKAPDQTNKPNEPLSTQNTLPSDKQLQTNLSQKVQDQHPLKRSRNEFPYIPERSNEPVNISHNSLSNHQDAGFSASAGNSGVSLTLGLRQNNGNGMSEPFPMNIAHRFGLEVNNDGYVINGFEAPNRHYGKDIGGQLLHDFVG